LSASAPVAYDRRVADWDQRWVDELSDWLRIPSVSADPAHRHDVREAAEWLRGRIGGMGGTSELVETDTHPIVDGDVRASTAPERAATVLLYGHVDVQPEDPLELWDSPPFEPEVRDGRIYARGATDDKGNLFLLVKAVELLAGAGELPVNVRFVCDGEEESGGQTVGEYIRGHDRGADACIIFDGNLRPDGRPVFATGARGNAYFHLRLRTGDHDLHSGSYGGAAMNAVHALMETLVAVTPLPEELRAGVAPADEAERAAWEELEPGAQLLAAQGATPRDEAAAGDFHLRTRAQPSIDVNGIVGGSPHLRKTVLPVEAEANVSIRLAPGQDRDEIAAAFERLLRAATPTGARLEIKRLPASAPALVPRDSAPLRLAAAAFERVLGVPPFLVRSGGSLPVLASIAGRGIPAVVTGFGTHDANIHAPNERFRLDYLPLGVAAARETLLAFGELSR